MFLLALYPAIEKMGEMAPRPFELTLCEMSRAVDRNAMQCEDIVRDCLARIEEKNPRLNALVAVFHDSAIAEARQADEARRVGRRKSPLDGLPVSVKENIDLAGRPVTLGIVARKNRVAAKDAGIVRALKRAGAIVVAQGNVPQLLLSHETRNPLYGVTHNAFSDAHGPGGSSGGEATAVASGMVPLGIGTDIGGSIRIPAHFSSVVGFKPTLDRWSNLGSNGALPGQEAIRSQLGPLARSVEDVALVFQSLDAPSMSADDPLVPPLPCAGISSAELSKLRIGVARAGGLVKPSVSVLRALQLAEEALSQAGFEVTEFDPPAFDESILLYFSLMSADGGLTAWRQLEGSAVESTLLPLRRMASIPGPVRRALAAGLRVAGEQGVASLLQALGERTVAQLWKLTLQARVARRTWLESMAAQRVDLLLCPAHATPAIPHGLGGDFVAAGAFSMLFNLFQFPAGVLPVTKVLAEDLAVPRAAVPQDRFEKKAKRIDEASLGLPLGVQVVGKPFADAAVLGVMSILEQAVRGRSDLLVTPHS